MPKPKTKSPKRLNPAPIPDAKEKKAKVKLPKGVEEYTPPKGSDSVQDFNPVDMTLTEPDEPWNPELFDRVLVKPPHREGYIRGNRIGFVTDFLTNGKVVVDCLANSEVMGSIEKVKPYRSGMADHVGWCKPFEGNSNG